MYSVHVHRIAQAHARQCNGRGAHPPCLFICYALLMLQEPAIESRRDQLYSQPELSSSDVNSPGRPPAAGAGDSDSPESM